MATHRTPDPPDPPPARPPGSGAFWPVAGLLVLIITAVLTVGLLLAPGCGRTNTGERPPATAAPR